MYDLTYGFCCRFLKPKDRTIDQMVQALGGDPDTTYEDFRQFCETRCAEVVANIAVCLVHQANYLLDKQIRHLEKDFLQNGGVRERMSRVRRHRGT